MYFAALGTNPIGRWQYNRTCDLSTELAAKIKLQPIANWFSLALTGCLQLYLSLPNRQFDLKLPMYNYLSATKHQITSFTER